MMILLLRMKKELKNGGTVDEEKYPPINSKFSGDIYFCRFCDIYQEESNICNFCDDEMNQAG